MSDKLTLTPQERYALEAEQMAFRIIELRASPVRGNFDAAHLKEINRRIFQDLPGLGFDDVKPGEYRPTVAAGNDWTFLSAPRTRRQVAAAGVLQRG